MDKLYCYGCQTEFDKKDVMVEEGIKSKMWICLNCFRSEEITEELEEE